MAFQRTQCPDEQCGRCGTIYAVESVDYPQRDSGEFRCHACGLQLRRWKGTREWSYTLRARGTGRPRSAFEVKLATSGLPSLIVGMSDVERVRDALNVRRAHFDCHEQAIDGHAVFDFTHGATVAEAQRIVNEALADPHASP